MSRLGCYHWDGQTLDVDIFSETMFRLQPAVAMFVQKAWRVCTAHKHVVFLLITPMLLVGPPARRRGADVIDPRA